LVAHCGAVNRGSYIHSLVLTDIASGWTEAAPLVVRESGLVVETLERIRVGLPFALRALDVDNGSEFVNDKLIEYCLGLGIELTRSRPYRKNDQAWIEQKNGAVVRKLLGYRRFEGIATAQTMTRLYGSARLFVNFFQPSFKLAEKHRDGAQVSKRYHPPQTPCERLLQAENLSESAKAKLRAVADGLDPLRLLEEIRAMQARLIAIAEGDKVLNLPPADPDLAGFLVGLASAWRAGEVRPTFSAETKRQYLRGPRAARSEPALIARAAVTPSDQPASPAVPERAVPQRPNVTYAARGEAKVHALTMVWPIVCRRLEGSPNINCKQLFEELCVQFPGRFSRWQYKRLARHVKVWREDARARGVEIERRKQRRLTNKPRSRRRSPFAPHWPEMLECLEAQPDQTALELLVEFQTRYPGQYTLRNLSSLQRRVRVWRGEAVQRLICEMKCHTEDVTEPASGDPTPQGLLS
jgi:hypothetical protein